MPLSKVGKAGVNKCCNPPVYPFHTHGSTTVHFMASVTNRKPHAGSQCTRGNQMWPNGDETITSAASEAFARWMHQQAIAIQQCRLDDQDASLVLCGLQTCIICCCQTDCHWREGTHHLAVSPG